ncbi:MAG: hypothetical protein U5J96_11065, partial [Ignavibacteriaceae bacterium]|nr:hypothetical protein [Ignavibacteriaceae bacterium]
IKNQSSNEVCNIHKPVYVNLDESVQYCIGCSPSSEYKKAVYAVHQPELTVWLSKIVTIITSLLDTIEIARQNSLKAVLKFYLL